uniref:Uncharacterized protein n=1 Tax=Utricularia reniformis TaxID=192314 RepID=A0A1Y0B3T0_9LAMI|nr:hypothetical protein AEK19_MT0818 [Utricularia reniformis]YP_009382320.1 hypothetical protein AEK19_MT1892 [Utricularia reniformis]ART31052.1 hypothetical protein AEK19_MT0818 [Utricularia reniformis]ART32060.1 hypothetical protein AEK19_MT1892 [Utricularia reniformis]
MEVIFLSYLSYLSRKERISSNNQEQTKLHLNYVQAVKALTVDACTLKQKSKAKDRCYSDILETKKARFISLARHLVRNAERTGPAEGRPDIWENSIL